MGNENAEIMKGDIADEDDTGENLGDNGRGSVAES